MKGRSLLFRDRGNGVNQSIREVGPADAERWDAFVAAHPMGSAFVTWESQEWWRVQQWDLRLLGLFEGDDIVAGLPFVLKRAPYTPARIARIPAVLITREGGTENATALLEAADQVFRSSGVIEAGTRCDVYIGHFVRGTRYDDRFREFLTRSSYRATRYAFGTYLKPINVDDETLLQSFSQKCRYNVRRGLSHGVEVVCSEGLEDFKAFIEIHRAMSLQKHLPPLTDEMYQTLVPMLERGYLRLFVARYNGIICNTLLVNALGTRAPT